MNGFSGLIATLGLLLLIGTAVGVVRRESFSPLWLLVAAGLVGLNDFLLTGGYGLLPDIFPASDWNWQGKLLALAATLAVAALPAFGWRRSGLTLVQAAGSLRSCIPVAFLYCAFFAVLGVAFPGGQETPETVAFQVTMPGLEEELFYRGVLLLALDQAYRDRIRFFGVEWGWGAILSCALFGLTHAFGFSDGHFSFDPLTMALTALPAFIAVWLRLRTCSLLLPVLLHNFGNSITMLV